MTDLTSGTVQLKEVQNSNTKSFSEKKKSLKKRRKQAKVMRVARASLLPVEGVEKRKRPGDDDVKKRTMIDLFSSKWLSVAALKQVEQATGLEYKKGKFSNAEATLINAAVQRFLVQHEMTFDEFKELFFQRRGHRRLQDFFVTCAQELAGRPVIHVYHYLRRQYHPGNWQGRWSAEKDDQLKRLFVLHGPKWEVIGEQLGRFHVSCKDRYRIIRQRFNSGRWQDEEVVRLRDAILAWRSLSEKPDCAVWAWIAERVETRSWMQCLVKYTGSLEAHMRRNPNCESFKKPLKWTDQEDLILIHKIYDLVVEDESEIEWSRLLDESWNHWSPVCLSRRWMLLRRRVYRERYLDMDTILETLMRSIKPLSPDKISQREEIDVQI